jgi:hypothetical protein
MLRRSHSAVFLEGRLKRRNRVKSHFEGNARDCQMRGYEAYEEKFWRASEMHMVNHQAVKETVLILEDYNFNVRFREGDFKPVSLKRSH